MKPSDENVIEIIDAPEVKTLSRKIADYSITAIMWVLWLYLLLPIINMLLWAVGVHHLYNTVFTATSASDIMSMMNAAGWIILGVFVVLRVWGLYNYWAFGRHDRRKAKDMSTIYGLARYHRIPPSRILDMQERQEMVWPMYRSIHPDKDVEDWLAGKPERNVTPIRNRAEEYASTDQAEIEFHLPQHDDGTQKKAGGTS